MRPHLERWLGLQASDEYDSRDNLVAHFLGWAIVFDLAREFPDDTWEEWLARFEREAAQSGKVAVARRRMGRTRWGRISNLAFPTLREAKLPDEREQKALEDMYQSMRRWDSRSSRSTQSALEDLARFWEE